ncbi:hypothetical protein QE152_g4216 [Popillia japonica]|uniref:Uncharacterized protein n=1 Tax=Popillia japonica TaxID=7064 RepID=A0AAW1N3C1_POPJA
MPKTRVCPSKIKKNSVKSKLIKNLLKSRTASKSPILEDSLGNEDAFIAQNYNDTYVHKVNELDLTESKGP